MSFWGDLPSEGNFDSAEVGGGDFQPIPDGTKVVAMVTEAKWDNTQRDGDFIKLRWDVVQEGEFKGRVVSHKVKVCEPDKQKAEKHKRMLMVIDHHCGGHLLASGEAPTDYSLQRLLQKPMIIKVGMWEIDTDLNGMPLADEDIKRGNWVMAVEGRKKSNNPPKQPAPQKSPEETGADHGRQEPTDDYDDDVPF